MRGLPADRFGAGNGSNLASDVVVSSMFGSASRAGRAFTRDNGSSQVLGPLKKFWLIDHIGSQNRLKVISDESYSVAFVFCQASSNLRVRALNQESR